MRAVLVSLGLVAGMTVVLGVGVRCQSGPVGAAEPVSAERDRSPVDLVLSADERWLLTANQTAGTVSLVDLSTGKVVAEVPCGDRPSALALTPDQRHVLVSATYSGELTILALEEGRLRSEGRVYLGFEPRGIAVSPDGQRAYVALTSGHVVAVVDLRARHLADRIEVGRWPRYLALTADGRRLAVGVNGDGGVAVVDTQSRQRLYLEDFSGLNLGQMYVSANSRYVYFPWMVYRHNPITPGNIRLGWVLASRIARVRLDGPARREAIALDPPGQAVADPHGLALSPDEQWLVCAASGTHELLVYKLPGLPFQDYGGPGDHIHPDLLKDRQRFDRIPLGGRPMAARFSRDGRHVFVANYLLNAVQVVDVPGRRIVRTIDLGGPPEPSLARRGEAIFYDGQRSLDQWYSCHSCHYEGHTNAVAMDTRNDGRNGNFKVVLSLRNVVHTPPWTWHGWQRDFAAAMRKSLTDTMQMPEPRPEDVEALTAFLATLTPPPNPYRRPDGSLSEAARRGEVIFHSEKAGCARCHPGPYFTDGKVHNVFTNEPGDVYKGYNPPSLIGSYDRVRYLHDGRCRSLEECLKGPHNPAKVTNRGELTDAEMNDLLEYVRSL
ncbi:MAG: beta-propeller fold lactonase family protein [Gemmataceae bacterium]|nr:beta-propeller fold lactonase family protein [Gemmataceae bacterium]MDW8265320.1 beta-propeller fold lactonase family protein [Gemmataceae bacterium]